MSRLHDMGGRFGDGPIPVPRNNKNEVINMEPTFKHNWQAKAWAITLAAGALGEWNLDISRHYRECLPSKDYINFSYYEKWLAALTNLLIDKNLISLDELKEYVAAARKGNLDEFPKQNVILDDRAWLAEDVQKTLGWGGPSIRDTNVSPIFNIGDKIITQIYSPNENENGGHTRLPKYAMGRVGKVYSYNKNHVFPDKNAHGLGESPLPLYTVEFKSPELWGISAEHENDSIFLDLWEPYLNHYED